VVAGGDQVENLPIAAQGGVEEVHHHLVQFASRAGAVEPGQGDRAE
jgi:hypothetical protein